MFILGSYLSLSDILWHETIIYQQILGYWSFPGNSAGKESASNAGYPGLIPGLGRSPGKGIEYPLQYSWASLVAQLEKNPSAMPETWVRSLGWEDPLEKETATHSNILTWRIPWTVESMGSQSWTRLSNFHSRWVIAKLSDCPFFKSKGIWKQCLSQIRLLLHSCFAF